MELYLQREPSINGATNGALYIDGHWFCWTIEDQIREQKNVPVEQWKVYGQTAIPEGRYSVVLSRSPRLGFETPEVLNVPGFTGIRIHPFNTAQESLGCIAPGLAREPGRVINSRVAFNRLMDLLLKATIRSKHLLLVIRNPWSLT